ncbi:MAG: RluA family pseudouridine synthase [Clostridia bacterium]|nr:RluA family pseudouridine synthase [Clostridia bacterium]
MEYRTQEEENGKKLKEILRGPMKISYSALKSTKWNGEIRLNGKIAHTNTRVQAGDLISVVFPEANPAYQLKPYDLPLKIVYEDRDLRIVDKPAGLASQSSRNHPDDSLENALYAWDGCPESFIYRPVNRLDKGTGGLMVIARNAYSQHLLQQMLHTDRFRRFYLARTDGHPPEEKGKICLPIGKAPGMTLKRMICPEGKPSVTYYRVIAEDEEHSLILLELGTGRTHQIRVHLSAIGCPIQGDFLYGREDPAAFPACFALHSAGLMLTHPVTGETIRRISLPEWSPETDPSVLFMDFH